MPSAVGSSSYLAIIKADPLAPRDVPATPVMQKLNFTSTDIGAEISTTVSENIRGDRRTTSVTLTGFTVGGGFSSEMTYDASLLDELMAAALYSDWSTNVLKDGDTYQPFYMERGHPDVGEYFTFNGMSVNTMTMGFSDQSMVTQGFTFLGLETDTSTAITPDATYTNATSNPVFSTVTDVSLIKIDGVAQTDCSVKEWTLEVNNNVTGKTGVGIMGACSTNAHKLSITGAITMYFSNTDMYARLLAGTSFSFEWTMTDSLGNSYHFNLPKCQLDANSIPVDGPDDIMENASFVVLADTSSDSMITITRTAA